MVLAGFTRVHLCQFQHTTASILSQALTRLGPLDSYILCPSYPVDCLQLAQQFPFKGSDFSAQAKPLNTKIRSISLLCKSNLIAVFQLNLFLILMSLMYKT